MMRQNVFGLVICTILALGGCRAQNGRNSTDASVEVVGLVPDGVPKGARLLSSPELRALLIGKRLTTVGGPKKGTYDQGDEAFRADETWMKDPTWESGDIPTYGGRIGSMKLWFERDSYCVLIYGVEGRCSQIWKYKDGRSFLKHYYYKKEADERKETSSSSAHQVRVVSLNYDDAIVKKKGTQ